MKSACVAQLRAGWPVVVATGWLLGSSVLHGGVPLDEAAIQSLRIKSSKQVDEFIDGWVESEATGNGRPEAADSISQLLVDHPNLVEQAALLRKLGGRVEPEFSDSVLQRLETTGNGLTRGSLLQLLRDTAPENVPRIAQLLSDTRPGEDLVERSQTAPKLGEAIASGVEPFRVCDFAFNIITGITSPKGERGPLLTHSQEFGDRDVQVRLLEAKLLPEKAAERPKAAPPHPTTGDGPGSDPSQSSRRAPETPVTVEKSSKTGVLWVAVAAVLAIAAWFGFRLKKRP